MSKRILLLTDSLPLPRFKPEVCEHQFTYPELLKQKGYIVHQVSIGGATSGDILRQVNYHKAFNPDFVFVQVGIVDCAPRFFTRLESELFIKFGGIGKTLMRLRKSRNKVYVDTCGFKANINSIKKSYEKAVVYFVGILPATSTYENILPGVTQNIKAYNSILQENTNYILSDDINSDGIMSDGHHLNALGHKQIFEKINAELQK